MTCDISRMTRFLGPSSAPMRWVLNDSMILSQYGEHGKKNTEVNGVTSTTGCRFQTFLSLLPSWISRACCNWVDLLLPIKQGVVFPAYQTQRAARPSFWFEALGPVCGNCKKDMHWTKTQEEWECRYSYNCKSTHHNKGEVRWYLDERPSHLDGVPTNHFGGLDFLSHTTHVTLLS